MVRHSRRILTDKDIYDPLGFFLRVMTYPLDTNDNRISTDHVVIAIDF